MFSKVILIGDDACDDFEKENDNLKENKSLRRSLKGRITDINYFEEHNFLAVSQ